MIDARMVRSYFRPLGIDEFQDLVANPNVQIRFYNGIPHSAANFFRSGDLRFLCASNHDKILIIDGRIALVGTYNLNPLSMVINSELMATVNNREFATMVRLRILKMTESAVRCEIRRERDGSITRVKGPEQYSSEADLRRMNLLVRFNWLRNFL
jgi:phosphatidylserine/phosphatidylglycerophosphate/cardiolipin synthase-like enzyme